MSTHDELKANAAGYVLGSLDPAERHEFESHLAQCAECSAEVASLLGMRFACGHPVSRVDEFGARSGTPGDPRRQSTYDALARFWENVPAAIQTEERSRRGPCGSWRYCIR